MKPIIFNGAMVRAILEGRKTQTRRVIKGLGSKLGDEYCTELRNGEIVETATLCPYGTAGDYLWVRETLNAECWGNGNWRVLYATDKKGVNLNKEIIGVDKPLRFGESRKVIPSIHMPKWASRITLEITGVRVERLQDISFSDILDEGIPYQGSGDHDAEAKCYEAYMALWNKINIKRGYSWEVNPFVWVIEFKRVQS